MSLRAIVFSARAEDFLPGLDDDSADSVVCDPPYALEFMGKEWDTFSTGDGFRRSRNPADAQRDSVFGRVSRTSPEYQAGLPFQQWCQSWAEQCLRILKPGGYLLAFGGTRTSHRLACGIEDAGFEIRDALHWLYGCLTADTEILTEYGWKPGTDVVVGENVAQWDSNTGRVTLAPAQQTYRAPWDGFMRVLRNADTDQVLTPNHRVYHQPGQRKMAGGVRRSWYDKCWRVAEAGTLSTWNPVRLPLAGEHDGSGIGGDDYAALLGWIWTEGSFDSSGTGVRIHQCSANLDKVNEIAALMDRSGPHKRYDYQSVYKYAGSERKYTRTIWFFSGELAERVRADLTGKRPDYSLLWRMTAAEKRAFLRAAMLGDGSGWGTRSEQFYQQYEDDLVWLQTLLALTGRSGKVHMRPNRSGGALDLRKRGTTELQARHLRDAWEYYAGEVWCVQVPAGAFIARRSGKIFITGNSGFVKSAACLKPAHEPVVMARKPDKRSAPLPGRDACRVAPASEADRAAYEAKCASVIGIDSARTADSYGTWTGTRADSADERGRMPPNVLLTHSAACNGQCAADCPVALVDAQSGRSVSRKGRPRKSAVPGDGYGMTHTGAEYDDTGGASRFYPVLDWDPETDDPFLYCAKAPKSERPRVEGLKGHPTVKPLKLCRWLARLVTPQGGLILDPFTGTGPVVQAALLEGFRCIALDSWPEAVAHARVRLAPYGDEVFFA